MQENPRLTKLRSQPINEIKLTGESSPDYHLHNADWSKQTWDLPKFKGAAQFKEYLKQRGQTVDQFKKLPVYNATNRPAWVKEL